MGNPVIFKGTRVQTLKSGVDLFDQASLLSGTVDPSSSATTANPGSLYLNTSSGSVYKKNDSGSTTNWSVFGAGGVSAPTAIKTANYNVLTSDGLVRGDSSGGTFTFTLFTPVGNAGVKVSLTKTDSSFIQIAISGTGLSAEYLSTQWETVTYTSDGTNWVNPERYIPSIEVTATMTFGGGTPPTRGSGVTELYTWSRIGDKMRLSWSLYQTGGGSGGTGAYQFTLPGGLTIDGAKQTISTSAGASVCGSADFTDSGNAAVGNAIAYSSTTIAMYVYGPGLGGPGLIGSAFCAMTGAGNRYSFTAIVPITGWNG